MAQILLTGAAGFIGRALSAHMRLLGHDVKHLSRDVNGSQNGDRISLSTLEEGRASPSKPFDAIIHLAALAHVTGKPKSKRATDYQSSNVELTRRLCDFARYSNAKRFVFLSSIGAVAANSQKETIDDFMAPRPVNEYGKSKLEAELLVGALRNDGILAVSLRSPLVVGPNAPGNWGLLTRLASTGAPLPFRRINNKRSLISLQSLCEIIVAILEHPANDVAASGAYVIADQESLSTADMIIELRRGLGLNPRLYDLPVGVLRVLGTLIGRRAQTESLLGDLVVDASRVRRAFGWRTTLDIRQCIRNSAKNPRARAEHRNWSKRLFDIPLALAGLALFAGPLLLLAVAIRLDSPGPAVFKQNRVGRDGQLFVCYKLRTMSVGAPNVPTHEITPNSITRLGYILRAAKIDELPQLWNVIKGDMSLVGPRPCLSSQVALIEARRANGVDRLRPGITGVAQISGIDMKNPELLADTDSAYLYKMSLLNDIRIIIVTISKLICR